MNRNIFAGLAISAVMVMAGSAPALANNAAFTIDNNGCIVPDQNFESFYADSDHTVVTSSGKGNFKCYASARRSDSVASGVTPSPDTPLGVGQ
jgi:hypothetical protein